MLLYVLYAVVAIIAMVLALAATKPDAFRIERSLGINAPADQITPHITDFHNWAAWSPWEKLDPALQRTFSGAEAGKGAVYAWQGNKKVGSGRMEITDASPAKVTIKLDFIQPFAASNITEFHVAPGGSGSQVTWAMTGNRPYMHKVIGMLFNMDDMVGKDFERGLVGLKQVSEQSASA